ncbi:Gp138 family membrane-puncturing spike protein [Salinarimonas soli]|uniref:Phage protein Gp138 N-terminal domain-containing protein n=1 Tax=Salinarimonas soli TaxID=1638099 RepID=A0A5B2VFC8_9HYPH|nr:Gp138 family membrane-puncturing spike protein [Salinarimonas soli]KAA2237664.1 hypothetical protein F0L46_08260 [Salinarimonas soli]
MAIDVREAFDDGEETLRSAIEGHLANLWTAVPARIVSHDGATGKAVLQPSVKIRRRKPDGTQDWISLPQLADVPVHFPHGGGVTMTFPVEAGDEALVVFASRSIDAWAQSGGEQQQVDARMHSLSDGFAFVGFRSAPRALANVSTDATQIRSDDGETLISLEPGANVFLKHKATSLEITEASAILRRSLMLVSVTNNRVDLGGLGGSAVQTVAGPSTKVFAIL